MNNPFFSIIIPAYNRGYILPKTIGSVQTQTFVDWELIVVDDGSTDNTKEVMSGIDDSRISYVYQHNAERSAARNNGIANSKGEYICFLDSDDWYEPNHLETLYREISTKEFPVAMFFTNCYNYQHNQKTKPVFPEFSNPAEYLLDNPVIPARVCAHSFILNQFKFREDIVIVEDQVLWVTIAFNFPVFYIPEYTVVYHLHEDNSINVKNNCFKPRLDGLQLLFKQPDISPLIEKRKKREMISNCYYGMAKHYFYKRKLFKMIHSILLSLLNCPVNKQNKAKLFLLYAYVFKPNMQEF